MGEVLPFLAPFLLPIAFYVALSLIGLFLERNHEQELDEREARVAGFLLLDLDHVPGTVPQAGQLVSGNVVMGTGYLKQLTAAFRSVVGGEVKGYQRVLERARREAQLRMIESAVAQGAQAIVNVRFETSDVGGVKPFSEIFCYGTALHSGAPTASP